MARSYFKIRYLLSLVAVLAIGYWYFLQSTQLVDFSTVHFLDVGQGDAIYIRTHTQQDVLIDGGPDDTVIQRLGEVMPFWDHTIELIILSHPDSDHSTGIAKVLQYYKVERIILVERPIQSAVHQQLMDSLAEQHVQIIYPVFGDQVTLNDQEYFSILYPFNDTPTTTLPANDTSIVMEYHFSGSDPTTILFNGDISTTIETQLVNRQVLRDIDILKVPHHGSKTSSSARFLAAINPEYNIIQVSKDNHYGHPTPEVLQRLQPYGIVLRNDQLGTITFKINDAGYQYYY